jgi:hypothetical protein
MASLLEGRKFFRLVRIISQVTVTSTLYEGAGPDGSVATDIVRLCGDPMIENNDVICD